MRQHRSTRNAEYNGFLGWGQGENIILEHRDELMTELTQLATKRDKEAHVTWFDRGMLSTQEYIDDGFIKVTNLQKFKYMHDTDTRYEIKQMNKTESKTTTTRYEHDTVYN